MRFSIRLLLLLTAAPLMSHAQALSTASQLFQLSAFGGATGTWTGLPPAFNANGAQGRNIGLTVGVNLTLPSFAHFQSSVEVRGMYPVEKGSVDAQENALVGAKVERRFHRLHPYADFFYGRGRIDYENGGYPSPDGRFIYLYTNSAIYSPGGGLDLDLTDHFAAKVDVQYQRFATPVNSTGHIYAKPVTVGVIYRFDFNHRLKYTRDGMVRGDDKQPRPPANGKSPAGPQSPPAPAPAADASPAPDVSPAPPPPADAPPASTPTPTPPQP